MALASGLDWTWFVRKLLARQWFRQPRAVGVRKQGDAHGTLELFADARETREHLVEPVRSNGAWISSTRPNDEWKPEKRREHALLLPVAQLAPAGVVDPEERKDRIDDLQERFLHEP